MKKLFTLVLMSLLTTVGAVAQETWTIAGVAALCGAEWDPTATENDMTKSGESNYVLVKEGCVLEKGVQYGYKAVKDHAWTTSVPSGNANQYLTVQETGTYTVTFSLNVEFSDLSVETVKTGSAVIGEKTWTVAGSSVELFGTKWDATNTANDMTKQEDGTYKLELKNKALPAGKVEYKICANHAWSEAYPQENASFTVPEDGAYDVVLTFNPETQAVDAVPAKTGEAVIEKVYSLVGAFQLLGGEEPVDDDEASMTLFGGKWDVESDANNMWEEGSNFVYKKTSIKLPAGQIACKVAVNHSWAENYGADGVMDGSNVIAPIEQAGTYDVSFTFNPDTKILTIEPTLIAAGIGAVSTDMGAQTAIRYDLSGRRIGESHKGVVIMNGKKVAATR
jgi:hypothetical protein